jgi:putative tricarboxylic transport membrane protein
MQIRNGQDFTTGLLFIAIGLGAYWIAADYPMGTAMRPDTGVLPKALAWLLVGTGALLAGKALVVDGPRLTGWAWRPALMITFATVAFALLVDRIGLVLTMLVSMTLAALGTPETRWREYALFAIFMVVLGVVVFIVGLGMPIPIFPRVSAWL